MERLTKPATRRTGNAYTSAIGSGRGCWPKIVQRLAAYENTGLEPEQIVQMAAEHQRLMERINVEPVIKIGGNGHG